MKLSAFFMVLFFLSACTNKHATDSAAQALIQEVDFIELVADNANVSSTYPGSIEGEYNVDVKAQVSGYLDAIYVKEGEHVNKGQALFKIKGDVYNQQVDTDKASLAAALAAQSNAKIEVERLQPLVEAKVISEIQLRTAQANYEAATAQVAQAQSALSSSKINVDFTLITAPVSGYIGRIPNRIGNLITPNDEEPLTTLSEINNVFVYFSMSEADFIAYEKAKHSIDEPIGNIELMIADGSIYEFKGKLETASGNIDANTGSIAMKAIFPNPKKLLRSGGTGRVILHKKLNNILPLPKLSIKDIQDRKFVYKLESDNTVSMVPLQVSGSSKDDFFVKSGVAIGDKIAINRIDVLNHGTVVKPNVIKR